MSRPREYTYKGQRKSFSVRLTKTEIETLKKKYGSVQSALNHLLNVKPITKKEN